MFLSKKNASYFNKPKNVDPNKPKRILGGWQDDEQQKKQTYDFSQKIENKTIISPNILVGDGFEQTNVDVSGKKEIKEKYYLNWDELDQRGDIECQKKIVEEMVQPGGIRIKPNDNMLNQFLKETKGMDTHIIGSLLLSKIEVNYPFQVKAKALYTIQFLIKKNEKYLAYFKAQCQKLKQFPQPQDNIQNYRKILKTVLNIIGVSAVAKVQEEQKHIFVDPGYNDQPYKKQTNLGHFIQQNANKVKKTDNKKKIIGPGQSKSKVFTIEQSKGVNDDFLGMDLLGNSAPSTTNNSKKGQFNLLDDAPTTNAAKKLQLSFQQSLNLI